MQVIRPNVWRRKKANEEAGAGGEGREREGGGADVKEVLGWFAGSGVWKWSLNGGRWRGMEGRGLLDLHRLG